MAQSIRATTIDFHTRPLRTVLGVVASLAFVMVGAGLFLLNLGEFNGGFFFGVLASVCGSWIFWINYRAAALRGPSLSIGADGIFISAFSARMISWDDIEDLPVFEYINVWQIGVRLKDLAKYRPPRNWYDRLSTSMDFGSPRLPLDHYDQSNDRLVQAIERFAPPRLLPLVFPKPDHWIFRWGRYLFWGFGGVCVLAILLADAPGLLGTAIADGYRKGSILPQDDARAAQWYRWLAERNGLSQSGAQLQLGAWYLDGRGVPKDDLAAYHWLTRALAGGSRSAADLRATVALRAADFQTANDLAHAGLLRDFPEATDSLFPKFLRADGYKVAVSVNYDEWRIGAAWGRDTLDEALTDAMQRCNALEDARDRCRLFAIGDVVVAGLPPPLVAQIMSNYREAMTSSGVARERY